MVYLLTKNLALPKGWARKLLPRYIGPYKVVEVHTATSTVTLELPPELVSRQVHLMFHVSLIWAHVVMITVDFGISPGCYQVGGSKDSQLFRQQCCKVIYTSK